MAKLAKVSAVDSKSVEGLEDLLDTMGSVQGIVQSDDWKVEEVAEFLGLSTKTIRRRLKTGKIDGYLIDGSNGPEWRIKQSSLDNVPGRDSSVNDPPSDVQGGVDKSADKVLITELISKIEALTYRNGYLESQLVEREKELRLLAELSTKKSKRWSGFWQWFTNSKC